MNIISQFHKMARPAIVVCAFIYSGFLAYLVAKHGLSLENAVALTGAPVGLAGVYLGLKGLGTAVEK